MFDRLRKSFPNLVLLEHNYQRVNALNNTLRAYKRKGKGESRSLLTRAHTDRWRLQENKTKLLLNTELLGRSERRSTSDVDVGGAELAEETYCDEIWRDLASTYYMLHHASMDWLSQISDVGNNCRRRSWRWGRRRVAVNSRKTRELRYNIQTGEVHS